MEKKAAEKMAGKKGRGSKTSRKKILGIQKISNMVFEVFYFFSSLSTATGQLRCDRHCLLHRSCLCGPYRSKIK